MSSDDTTKSMLISEAEGLKKIGELCHKARVPIQMSRSQEPGQAVIDRAILLMAIEQIERIAATAGKATCWCGATGPHPDEEYHRG